MKQSLLRHYRILVEYLGEALGPDYEVVLHDLGDKAKSVAAICHGYISGRTVGAPLTAKALELLVEKKYEENDYWLNYSSLSKTNKTLRSSSLFIKDDFGRPVGLLCINFDDNRYNELCARVLKLCHPDSFVEHNSVPALLRMPSEDEDLAERFPDSVAAVVESAVGEVIKKSGLPAERLTQEEKLVIVESLERKGVFLLKGAVGYVARELRSSEASIYRYLGRLNKTS